MQKKPIILVDKDLIDKMAVIRTFKEINIKNPLITFTKISELETYMVNNNNAKPCLVFIDSYTAKIEGINYIKELKKDINFNTIPIVLFIGVKGWGEEFEFIADRILDKPLTFSRFFKVIKSCKFGWYLDNSDMSLKLNK